jgi:molybdopterin molybdotransferase
MITIQRLAISLTPLDRVVATLLDGIAPVAPVALPLAETPGCIVAEMPPLKALPEFDLATADGWACRSEDLVGASSWSPVVLTDPPVRVEAGARMPPGCDCVVDASAVEQNGPLCQVCSEAVPGQGVRRAGGDIANGMSFGAGRPVGPLDLLIARAAGLQQLAVRRPRLRLIDVPAKAGTSVTTQLIAESAKGAGCEVVRVEAGGRDAQAVAMAFDSGACDLFVTVGGTGVGCTDATVNAIAARGALLAHGIALQPGRTAAIGRIGTTPVIALPGAADQALAGWLTLVLPVLDRLSGRMARAAVTLPLARKIASAVGIAEIVLLRKVDHSWLPVSVGDLPLQAIAAADAWLAVRGGSEGYAAGAPAAAYMLRDCP